MKNSSPRFPQDHLRGLQQGFAIGLFFGLAIGVILLISMLGGS